MAHLTTDFDNITIVETIALFREGHITFNQAIDLLKKDQPGLPGLNQGAATRAMIRAGDPDFAHPDERDKYLTQWRKERDVPFADLGEIWARPPIDLDDPFDPDDPEELTADQLFQLEALERRPGLYRQHFGIEPSYTANPWRQYVEGRRAQASSAFSLAQAFAAEEQIRPGQQIDPEWRAAQPTYGEFLQASTADAPLWQIGKGQFRQLAGTDLIDQERIVAGLGRDQEDEIIRAQFNRLFPRGVAENLYQRLAGTPARQAYAVTPTGISGGDSFINYLTREYGL